MSILPFDNKFYNGVFTNVKNFVLYNTVKNMRVFNFKDTFNNKLDIFLLKHGITTAEKINYLFFDDRLKLFIERCYYLNHLSYYYRYRHKGEEKPDNNLNLVYKGIQDVNMHELIYNLEFLIYNIEIEGNLNKDSDEYKELKPLIEEEEDLRNILINVKEAVKNCLITDNMAYKVAILYQ